MKPVHTVNTPSDSDSPLSDQMIVSRFNVANVIGGGAGLAVVTTVTFAEPIPLPYHVSVTPDQDAVAFVTAKTAAGFTLTLNPRLAANTLAVGSNEVIVVA